MKEYKVKVFANRVEWYFEGKLHREGGPAIEYVNGDKFWIKNGLTHRENGPAAEYADGTKEWWNNGLRHREGGPAVEYSDGDKWWYKDGMLHREDGPAIEFSNGNKSWYLENNRLTKSEFNKAIKVRVKAKATPTCGDKCVEADGVKYKLVKI